MPALVVQGHEVPLSLKRAFALLAYLAFHPGPVPRAHLATLLWPDADEAQGRARLRRLVYTLEEAVGCRMLSSANDCLSLAAGRIATDALQFTRFARSAVASEALEEATLSEAREWIDRARRPLLQGISLGSEAFDDWVKAVSIEHEHLLARLLERVIDALARRGEFAAALDLAEILLALDTYREPSYVLLMQLHALQGHSAGVEATYTRCADVLRAEFGIGPGPQTEKAYLRMTEDLRRLWSHRVERPGVRFAESAAGTIAYTVLGSGEQALVVCPGFVCHIEIALEHPPIRACVQALAERFRVVLFDRRGIGMSERLRAASTPAALAQDIAAILDDAGLPRAWLFGSSEGSLGAMHLAVDHPDRVAGLCLFGALARGAAAPDYPWALPAAAYDVWLKRLVAGWGGPAGIETFAPSEQDDPAVRAWWARLVRHAASPGGLEAILAGLRDADMRPALERIRVPTLVMHRRGDRAVRFEAGEHLARTIPGAVWHPLEGTDHFWWAGDSQPVIQAILNFAGR
ncbi:alpha/beta hydrolase [Variovorax sp. YR216]|uniref:alpha/beta hydrolase n=1 Tax=Variovorax sp. YR216 TaxID=1882828 RepID=UPI00089BAFC3|nr:alpha/beta hydrolase [Variovorax sp. YR216]SEA41981.1 DNA-binding transcriptional activator of the SARP family [Variovorax sp. YR216]